jgi:hypothetical protein
MTTEAITDQHELDHDQALQALDSGLRIRVRDGKPTKQKIIDEAVLQIARRDDVIKQLRRELSAFVEASLDPCDYTTDAECPDWEPTDYDRAKANITEMHRVLGVRQDRLFDAIDEQKRVDAVVERLHSELAEMNGKLGARGGDNLELFDKNGQLTAELAEARDEIDARRVHDEATTHHLNIALWLHAEARDEITKLKHALSVAEPHEADVRLEVEREVRAEATEVSA